MRVDGWFLRVGIAGLAIGSLFGPRAAMADGFSYTALSYPGGDTTIARGINNNGDIIGFVTEPFETDFLYLNGSFSLFPGIRGISSGGVIFGYSSFGPYLFSNEVTTPLNSPLNHIIAIRENGLQLGTMLNPDGTTSDGLLSGSGFQPIRYPGSTSTTLSGLNDLGEVVGYFSNSTRTHGFLYQAGAYTALDFPGADRSEAFAINNNGEIVGNYWVSHSPTGFRGFTYSNGVYQSFAAFNIISEETATVPTGINDYGEITGYQFGGHTQSFIATPVPEPGTLGLVGVGLMGIAGLVQRRQARRVVSLRRMK